MKSAKLGPMEIQEGLLSSFVLDENTLNAKIVCCLDVVNSHHSFRSFDSLKNQFKIMFPDSSISDKFSLGKDKAKYMIIYGIYPAFKQKLKSMINNSPWYSVSFEENLNKSARWM